MDNTHCLSVMVYTGDSLSGLDDQQPTWVKLFIALGGSTHAKVWVSDLSEDKFLA